MIFKVKVVDKNKDAPDIVYKDLVVIRHSSKAYQVYLQGDA